jgi:hypothetical protein
VTSLALPSTLDPAARAKALRLLGGTLLGLYAACAVLAWSLPRLSSPDAVAVAISIDLTVTAAALVWWLGTRRGVLTRRAPLWVASLGVTLASRMTAAPLRWLVVVGPVLEVALLVWLVARLRRVVRGARAAAARGPLGPVAALDAGLVDAGFPATMAAIFASEFGVVWLACTGWFRRSDTADPTLFSMRRTSWLSMAGVVGFLIVVETFALHLVVAQWSAIAAWISTASSAYALLWLIADSHAIRLYPIAVRSGALWLRVGVRWRATIPLTEVVAAVEITQTPKTPVKLCLLDASVLVTLRTPVELRGPFGLRRTTSKLALTIDDPPRFLAAVLRRLP